MARHCSVCREEKPDNQFSWKEKGKKRQNKCKICHSAYRKVHYEANRDKYLRKSRIIKRQRQQQINQFIWDYKSSHPCVDCGESDPIVLEFDHLDNKTVNISAISRRGWSTEKIKQEIAKCQIRCANCHRRKTAKQFDWYKNIAR